MAQQGTAMCSKRLCLLILHSCAAIASGIQQQFCQNSNDCLMLIGATCQNSQCICLQTTDGAYLRPCPEVHTFGEKCSSDTDCGYDLICDRSDKRQCKCSRGGVWDIVSKRCYSVNDNSYVNKSYDLTKDVIIPSIILLSLAITASLCYRLFCTSKSRTWRRRRGNDMTRALEEAQLPIVGASQPTATWIASYRVFGTVERSGPPCLLLPVGPPPYEEALKHKVILSSCQPPMIHTTPL